MALPAVSWYLTEAGHEVLEGVLPVGLIRQVVVLRQGPPAREGRALVGCAERGRDTLGLLRGTACGRRSGVTYIPQTLVGQTSHSRPTYQPWLVGQETAGRPTTSGKRARIARQSRLQKRQSLPGPEPDLLWRISVVRTARPARRWDLEQRLLRAAPGLHADDLMRTFVPVCACEGGRTSALVGQASALDQLTDHTRGSTS